MKKWYFKFYFVLVTLFTIGTSVKAQYTQEFIDEFLKMAESIDKYETLYYTYQEGKVFFRGWMNTKTHQIQGPARQTDNSISLQKTGFMANGKMYGLCKYEDFDRETRGMYNRNKLNGYFKNREKQKGYDYVCKDVNGRLWGFFKAAAFKDKVEVHPTGFFRGDKSFISYKDSIQKIYDNYDKSNYIIIKDKPLDEGLYTGGKTPEPTKYTEHGPVLFVRENHYKPAFESYFITSAPNRMQTEYSGVTYDSKYKHLTRRPDGIYIGKYIEQNFSDVEESYYDDKHGNDIFYSDFTNAHQYSFFYSEDYKEEHKHGYEIMQETDYDTTITLVKWEYGDMKEFWRVNMSEGKYWHFKVDYYGLSFNRDFKGWNGVGVYVCWSQAYEKAKLGVYIRGGKYVVQKGFNPTIPGDKVYEQAKEKVVRLPNHVKF